MGKKLEDFTGEIIENWKCGKPFNKKYGKRTIKKVYPCICINCGNKREIPASDLKCKRNLQCKICNDKIHGFENDNLTGTRQGSLTIGEAFRKNGRTYYHVKCDCSKEYDILRNNLVQKKYLHCKCRGLAINPNKKYGFLTPLERMADGKWKCQCKCGKITYVSPSELIDGNTKSCGCKKQANNLKLRTDNKSGIKGVFQNVKRGKWIAYINKDGKRTCLGSYDTKDLAADARETAERALFEESK